FQREKEASEEATPPNHYDQPSQGGENPAVLNPFCHHSTVSFLVRRPVRKTTARVALLRTFLCSCPEPSSLRPSQACRRLIVKWRLRDPSSGWRGSDAARDPRACLRS